MRWQSVWSVCGCPEGRDGLFRDLGHLKWQVLADCDCRAGLATVHDVVLTAMPTPALAGTRGVAMLRPVTAIQPEALTHEAASALLAALPAEIGPGLSETELEAIECRYGFTFADDHWILLQAGLPLDRPWPDWRDGDPHELRGRLDAPAEGVLLGVEHGFWYPGWGERPDDRQAALDQRFAWFVDHWSSNPGFACVLGYDGDEPVGFAYGAAANPQREWWREHWTPDATALTSTFALSELMVRPKWRKTGAGHQLHEGLLEGRSEALAVLLVDTTHPRVQALYESWGYRKVGNRQPFADSPLYAVMLKQLQP